MILTFLFAAHTAYTTQSLIAEASIATPRGAWTGIGESSLAWALLLVLVLASFLGWPWS